MGERALLLFSGGVDSVQALIKRCEAGQRTYIHHVALHNGERRAHAERGAVLRIRKWLKVNHYDHLVEYGESTFDYGSIRKVQRDHNVWGLVAALVLMDKTDINQLVRTFHRDSVVGGINTPDGQKAELAWRQTIDRLIPEREIEFLYPQIDMSKEEIIKSLPEGVLELCWYCRRPQSGRPCHSCTTCRNVDHVLLGKEWIPLDARDDQ